LTIGPHELDTLIKTVAFRLLTSSHPILWPQWATPGQEGR
jgi:hypothetical protein